MKVSKVTVMNSYGDGHVIAEYTTIDEIEKVFKPHSPIGTTEMYKLSDIYYNINEVSFQTTPESTIEIHIDVTVLDLTD